MLVIGLIREGKVPADNRVALTPAQCKWLIQHINGIKIIAQPSESRCFSDREYELAGAILNEDLAECNLLLGIKEVPISMLISDKTYMFFSHTRKKQPYNQKLMQAMVEKRITLIDYESLVHEDGQRIIGFGFFAGIVGAHNGMMAYGNRTGTFYLGRVGASKDYRELIHTYFGLKLPKVKIAVTGNGRVAHGVLEVMNLMDVREVEPKEFLHREYDYPVYVHLKGSDLYMHKNTGDYSREDFRDNPQDYVCIFEPYCYQADILMNGIFWDVNMPRLFSMKTLKHPEFRIKTIADITDDAHGSVPCNLGDASIDEPVYGVNKITGERTEPYTDGSIDVMAVGNLPNELPKDASRYFGEQLIKYVLEDLIKGGSVTLDRATILREGRLTEHFEYLNDYAYS
jgi:saccharopine dehydrogenase (NAD+, L-lysine forming)